VVAKQTRDGTPTPDGVGEPIQSIAIILIHVKTIIIILY
jgi:hypothetical protein